MYNGFINHAISPQKLMEKGYFCAFLFKICVRLDKWKWIISV